MNPIGQFTKPHLLIIILLMTLVGCDGYQSKNNSFVYVTSDEGNLRVVHKIEGIDAKSFQILHKRGYAKDKYRAYFHWREINGADVNSFATISQLYAKDSLRVYYEGKIIDHADPTTFSLIALDWGKDHKDVYCQTIPINACSPDSFVFLSEDWQRDNKCVYNGIGRRLSGADPDSFQIINFAYGKDKKQVYFQDKVLRGADPASFELRCSPCEVCAKDKNRCYQWGEIADCACRN